MTSPTSAVPNDVRAAMLADGLAADLACAAHILTGQGDQATAEALLAMARHNRIAALKLRAEQGIEHNRPPPARRAVILGPARSG